MWLTKSDSYRFGMTGTGKDWKVPLTACALMTSWRPHGPIIGPCSPHGGTQGSAPPFTSGPPPQLSRDELNPPSLSSTIYSNFQGAKMRSSVATATSPPEEPVQRLVAVKSEKEGQKGGSAKLSEHDHFFWTYTEEPHRTRRNAIIKVHPEVRLPKFCHSDLN